MKRFFVNLATLVLLAFHGLAPAAAPIDDRAALRGVKSGKGVFLIDFTEPRKTAFYLDIIRGTHAGFQRQGVKPDLVIVYIGPTVRFLTRTPDEELVIDHDPSLQAIAEHVQALHALGVRQEVCSIATRVFKVDNANLLPGLSLVGDGFISLIGWQTQGYKLVPLF